MTNSVTVRDYRAEAPTLGDDPFLQLTRLFVYFLQNLFRDYPRGEGLHWSPDEEDTEIIITAEKPRTEAIEKTPHITCIVGASRWGGTSIDQMQSTKIATGERKHTDLMSCTVAYHCQAKEGIVARRMAWNASLYTNVLARILMRVGGIHHIDAKHDISPESPPTTYTGPLAEEELVSVVVTVPFFWQVQWKIRKPAEVWRGIRMMMNVNSVQGLYSAGRTNKLRPPAVKGRVVSTAPIVTDPPETSLTQEVREDSYPEQ